MTCPPQKQKKIYDIVSTMVSDTTCIDTKEACIMHSDRESMYVANGYLISIRKH